MTVDRQRRVRLGVVGLGAMGRRHLRSGRVLDDIEVVGVADPSYADHDPVPGVNVVPSLDDLLELGVDACVVATPSPDHVGSACALADAGVHVLIEKPLAMDSEQCRRILACYEGTRLAARVGHVERFNGALLALREQVQAGAIGELTQIVTRREAGPPRRADGGDVLLDLGTHDFDLVAWLTGSPIEVASCATSAVGCAPPEEVADVELRLDGGIVSRHSLSWQARERVRTVTVHGTSGVLTADSLRGAPASSVPAVQDSHRSHDPLTAQLRAWIDLIAGRVEPDAPMAGASLADGARAVAIAELARASLSRSRSKRARH